MIFKMKNLSKKKQKKNDNRVLEKLKISLLFVIYDFDYKLLFYDRHHHQHHHDDVVDFVFI